ncbi:Protein-serine/threonine phosphatase [Lentibacillus sp. JNUCC-1]|uniref:bis(5'-nucleosyl)-tetraphosphatase PrpE n=1 Tax=Lentibacillus sp. JNUCC-1 TaxID=2654513 RepID=UPI0012E977AE|nr:bis(5'-nucleosyl)-tetraphosphatase PrpE [Lentibacillus sp. JNUCC-1]MUV36505.1 Protein-serine/threonine phosphatase [Lentibacillus sp. JNUCC-1]
MKIDVIGDVHGCVGELKDLFAKLGYVENGGAFIHPEGRIPVFLGDLTDRGPDSVAIIKLVSQMVLEKKTAKYVPGNHCNKLYRYFRGNPVQQKHGLETTVAEYMGLSEEEQKQVQNAFMTLYENAPLYLVLKDANAIIAHAGIKSSLIGEYGKKAESFVLYGDVSGKTHPDGRPIRGDWAQTYTGSMWVVYGHTPVLKPRIVHKTINIDTGCVFGGALTAFRLPEETTVSVPSKQPFQKEKFSFTE